jgi:hypothetical protein
MPNFASLHQARRASLLGSWAEGIKTMFSVFAFSESAALETSSVNPKTKSSADRKSREELIIAETIESPLEWKSFHG